MTNLTELIEQWIGEEISNLHKKYLIHRNNTGILCTLDDQIEILEDLKSKIPDLIEQIEKEYELTERF